MGTANQAANEAYEQGQDQCEQRDAQGHPETGKDNRKVKGRPFLISLVVLLELVPGTLFLKTLHPDRYLAIPVDLLESVPAPRIIPGHSIL